MRIAADGDYLGWSGREDSTDEEISEDFVNWAGVAWRTVAMAMARTKQKMEC